MTPQEVLGTPIRQFWLLVKNVDRIESFRALKELRIGFGAARGNVEELYREFQTEIGTVNELEQTEFISDEDKRKLLAFC